MGKYRASDDDGLLYRCPWCTTISMGVEAAKTHSMSCSGCETASRQKIKELEQKVHELLLELEKYKPRTDPRGVVMYDSQGNEWIW